MPSLGLRERKKDQTRRHLAEVAFRLFATRGFDAVTIADIAEAAEVANKTVFNYFQVKEDLVLAGRQENDAALLAALGERTGNETIPEIVRRLAHRVRERVSSQPREHRLAYRRIVASAASVANRWRQIMARLERDVAGFVAAELGVQSDDVLPVLIASGLTIVYGRLAYCDLEPRADGSDGNDAMAAADIDRAIELIAAQMEAGRARRGS